MKRNHNKKLKSLTILSSAVIITQPITTIAASGSIEQGPFSDIKGHWAEDILTKHYERGFVKGYKDGTFKPDQSIKRSELISLINRYFGLKNQEEKNYVDVTNQEWYSAETAKARYLGYVDTPNARPNDYATREDVIQMISKIIDIQEQKIQQNAQSFEDIDNQNEELQETVRVFSELGYLSGYSDGTFKPEGLVNRAEMITIIDRVLGYVVKSQEDLDKIPSDVKKITIINPDIIIENMNITADIYLSPGVDGKVIIRNSNIEGNIEIAGSKKENPIEIENTQVKKIIITKATEEPNVKILGASSVEEINTKSAAVVDIIGSSVVNRITSDSKSIFNLGGNTRVENAVINQNTTVNMNQNTLINNIEVNSDVEINGDGTIKKAIINSNNTSIQGKPEYVEVTKDLKNINIDGKAINPSNDDKKETIENVDNGNNRDTTKPVVGNEGKITVNALTETSVGLSWTAGSDNATKIEALEYKVVYSTINNIETAEGAEENGLVAQDWTANNTGFTVIGLTPGQTYYFNVLMRDKAGQVSVYQGVRQVTPDETNPTVGNEGTITVGEITETSVGLSWAAGDDNVSATDELQYKVVYSTSNNIETVEGAEENGLVAQDWTANSTGYTVTGLSSGQTYYFNVLIRDRAGNETVYTSKNALTKEPVPIVIGDATISITTTNAVDGRNLSGTTVNIRTGHNNTTGTPLYTKETGGTGSVTFSDLPYGDYTIEILEDGYITTTRNVTLTEDNKSIIISQAITEELPAGTLRIVLNWGANPLDLDSHVKNSSGTHILYNNPASDYITLDTDDIDGYGPETITINVQSGVKYRYFIYNFNRSNFNNDAEVKVYYGSSLLGTYKTAEATGNSSDDYWNVFEFTGHEELTEDDIIVNNSFASAEPGNPTAGIAALSLQRTAFLIEDYYIPKVDIKQLQADKVTAKSVDLSWNNSRDNSTENTNLEYKVVYSLLNNIGSVEDAEINGITAIDWTKNLDQCTLNGLQPNTACFINVLVRDEAGNTALYEPLQITTLDQEIDIEAPIVGGEGIVEITNITDDSLDLSWIPGTDAVSEQSNLEYGIILVPSSDSKGSNEIESEGINLWIKNVSNYTITGLNAGTSYYVNIVIRDEAGNTTIYKPAFASTLSIQIEEEAVPEIQISPEEEAVPEIPVSPEEEAVPEIPVGPEEEIVPEIPVNNEEETVPEDQESSNEKVISEDTESKETTTSEQPVVEEKIVSEEQIS